MDLSKTVGIFFKIGKRLHFDTVPLSDGEPYGDAIGKRHGCRRIGKAVSRLCGYV
jgi:hypothetical protein